MPISRRDVLTGAVSALAVTPVAWAATRSGKTWQMPPERPFEVIESLRIPMADGVHLSARLWRPKAGTPGRVPVVIEYIPYRKRDFYRFIDDLWGPQLASRGIAYARIDVRGSGDSEGVITDEYSEPELADGVACIEWLSRQNWCTGAVGMRGISWGGINTLQVAARAPRALKAIMPMGCCDNRFTDDAHYIGGALGHTNFQWGIHFKNVMAGPPDPAVFGEGWEAAWRQRLEATPRSSPPGCSTSASTPTGSAARSRSTTARSAAPCTWSTAGRTPTRTRSAACSPSSRYRARG